MRFFTGLLRPAFPSTGTDFAGVVEAVGLNAVSFKKGDRVWGFDDTGIGSHAEYITVSDQKPMEHIPALLSFEEAAACAEGAHYAYNFINKVELRAGQTVLVNGATGAIGSALVQFLTYFGISVTAVCNGTNRDRVRSLGAVSIIDYTKEDFTKSPERFDFVFDAVGKSTFARCKPLLKNGGVYISSELGPYIQNPLLALATPFLGGKKVIFPVPSDIKRSLQFIKTLIEEGKFKPLIDRRFPLEKIADAFTYAASGQKIGNIILTISP
jgi:NADPH:quinone reductase-like Zn-dependent oxidoreductase